MKKLLSITILLLGSQAFGTVTMPKTIAPEEETIIIEGQDAKPEEGVVVIQEEIPENTNIIAPEEGVMVVEETAE